MTKALELHNLGDEKKLDSINFLEEISNKEKFIDCDIFGSSGFTMGDS